MESLSCRYPSMLRGLLVGSSDFEVTAEFLLDSMVIIYSSEGSNKRTAEEAIILNWNEYATESNGSPVSVGDIVHFMSGSSKLPAAGFNCQPSIHFTDDPCLPKASTCEISITFPRSFDLLCYEDFKEKMDMCICNSFGFGIP